MIFLLLLPSLLLLVVVFLLPLFRYSWLSFHADSVVTGLIAIPNGVANWVRLSLDQRYWQALGQTFRFAAVSVSFELILALSIALLLDQRWRGRNAVRAIALIPWALPTTVMALGWRWILNTPYGPIDRLTNLIGFGSLNILGEPGLAWLATVLADVWKTTPFAALILLAGLQTIPSDLYEALRLEGANSLSSLRRITLPLLRPYILLALLFRLAQAFGVFDLIQVLTGGGPAGSTESVALYAYINALRFLDFGYSATIIISSFIFICFACLICWFLIKVLFTPQRSFLKKVS
ncbi:MAG: sugar ABC transporter permease [Propionibacteriaceae bacterium]|jgi:multiple sugar transport system permease protein|nr:sugar ABC transporter permease [Propionibacteriaceae bacterium]